MMAAAHSATCRLPQSNSTTIGSLRAPITWPSPTRRKNKATTKEGEKKKNYRHASCTIAECFFPSQKDMQSFSH